MTNYSIHKLQPANAHLTEQLWNYMRLTSTRIGILYNFAPVKDECERYYLDATTGMMYAF